MKKVNYLMLSLVGGLMMACSTTTPNKCDNMTTQNQSTLGATKISTDGRILEKYGTKTTFVCSPIYVCDIEFESGEKILNTNMGDTQRWIVTGAKSGKESSITEHIIVKPIYNNLKTNMIVTTDKGRTYNFDLVSIENGYVFNYGFYY